MTKSTILLMLLLAFFAWRPELHAQCTNPPNCIQNIGTNPVGNLWAVMGQNINSSVSTTIPDWWVLFGTPVFGPGVSATTGIQMVSDASAGEGVYTCYNFRSGHTYQICLSAVNTTTVTGGSLILEAHNGTTGQIISNSVFYSGTLQEFSFSFTANSNYNQLRIYTNHTPSASNPYSVSVDDIGVVEVPVVTASPTTINGCGASTLTATSTNPLNITWSPATGLNTTQGNTVIARPCQTTTYTASYSSNGCFDGWSCDKTEQVTVTVQPGTNVTASPSTISGCGSSILTASSTNPMNVTWTPTTGLSSASGNVVTARPCQTTTYTARFTCWTGCTYEKQVTVYVQPGTNVTASLPTISVCGSTTLTASSANPMIVSWSPGHGLSSTHGNVVTASPCDTTTYTATYLCLQTGCVYTDSVTVNVQPNGSIADSSSSACFGPIDLEHVASPPCPGSTYKWFGPKNPSSLLSTQPKLFMPSSTPGDMGNYMVEITTPQGCVDTLYKPVVMNCCDVIADFNIIDCNPVRFENITQDSVGNLILQGEWYWDFGDGTTSTLRNPSHLYTSQLGPHTACLTAVVSDGLSTCCSKVCKDFEVCDFAGCPKAAFDYRVVNPGTGDVQFLDKSVGGGTVCGWTWKVNGMVQASTQNPTITLGGPGTYNICLEVCRVDGSMHYCYEEWCEDIIIP